MTNTVSDIVSDEELNAIIQIESAGRPAAEAETSTALGLGQFLEATWMGVVRQHRPDLLTGRSREQVLNLRIDPSMAVELLARFTEDNRRAIGMKCGGGDLYLAHFLGVADAKDLFRAPPDTQVSTLVKPQVIAANRSIMQGKSAGQVRAWAAKKMAQPPKANWVAKYYRGDTVVPLPTPRPADIDPNLNGKPIEDEPIAPEPAPAPAPVPDHEPVPVEKKKETFGGWLKRKKAAVSSWGSGLFGGGFLAYMTDWRVVLALGGIAIVAGLVVYFIWKANQK